ncbi:hypothetical protein B0A54_11740 [Friedmanniomyces endolithicus]|uniref:Uncharacterized protein n=1 Tax=Friedmanniomyces endolithicus TaxID=329885 RepID=A0A4U0URK9_9PEZI|nr:hypothetical protein B0A54_11740 [Friedmanniomyces endolithicus]
MEKSHTSEEILHTYFNKRKVNALESITNTVPAELLTYIEKFLRVLSTLQGDEELVVYLAQLLQQLQALRAHHAGESLNSQEAYGQLDADTALSLGTGELKILAGLSELVDSYYQTVANVRSGLDMLCARYRFVVSGSFGVESGPIDALIERVDNLAADMQIDASIYAKSRLPDFTEQAAQRAEDMSTIVKQGYQHEIEPVVQYLRDSMTCAGKDDMGTVVQHLRDTMARMGKEPPKGSTFDAKKYFEYHTQPSLLLKIIRRARDFMGW